VSHAPEMLMNYIATLS